jgi:HK97 gp10 family phage protein
VIEFEVKGFAELERQLRSFPVKVEKRILARSVYAGAAVIRKVAQGNIAVRTGETKRMVRIFKARRVRPGTVIYRVGLLEDRSVKKLRGHIGRFLERGTSKMSARPWLRPALDNSHDAALSAIRGKMAQGISTERFFTRAFT